MSQEQKDLGVISRFENDGVFVYVKPQPFNPWVAAIAIPLATLLLIPEMWLLIGKIAHAVNWFLVGFVAVPLFVMIIWKALESDRRPASIRVHNRRHRRV